KEEAKKRSQVLASLTGLSLGGPALNRAGPWRWAIHQKAPLGVFDDPFETIEPLVNPYVSLAGLRFSVQEVATHSLAQTLLDNDLDRISAELKKKSDDRAAFEKVLQEARKTWPWWDHYTGKTREAVDRYAFLTAPELLPLRNVAGVSRSQSEEEQIKE